MKLLYTFLSPPYIAKLQLFLPQIKKKEKNSNSYQIPLDGAVHQWPGIISAPSTPFDRHLLCGYPPGASLQFSIFLSLPNYSSSLPGEPLHDSRQSQCLCIVSLVLSISSTSLPFLTIVFHTYLRHSRVENKVELKWQQLCFSRDLGSKNGGADLFKTLPVKIKCKALVSKFHMNAFPFSVHYDGNGPYHSICFALELSPCDLCSPSANILCHSTSNVSVTEHAGGLQGLNMRDLCICVPVWWGTCGSASVWLQAPLAREQCLERLPSRVAFVW